MKRSVLESNIAKYIELESNYSSQNPTESSTSATYVIDSINLVVKYQAGLPAPYVMEKNGSITHFPPIEQTVLSWKIEK